MRFHAVDILSFSVKPDGLTTLGFDAGVVLIFFLWPLLGVQFIANINYFTLLLGVSEAMQQAFLFSLAGPSLVWNACFLLQFPERPFLGLVGEVDSL